MDAGSVSGEFRRFSAPSCCNLRSAPARFAGQGFALQIPSPSSRRCCEPRVSAPRRAQPQPCRQRLEGAGSGRSDAERSVDVVGLASHRAGERCHGGGWVWANIPSHGITVELCLQRGQQLWVG